MWFVAAFVMIDLWLLAVWVAGKRQDRVLAAFSFVPAMFACFTAGMVTGHMWAALAASPFVCAAGIWVANKVGDKIARRIILEA